MRTWRAVASALVGSALLVALLPVSMADARKRCPGPKVLLINPLAQIYEQPEPGCGFETFYGRARGAKRRFELGLPPPEIGSASGINQIQHLALSGTMAAFEHRSGGAVESTRYEDWVVVRDLRTGRVVYHVPSGAPLHPKAGYVGVGQLVSLVVKSDGAAAWIAEDYERTPLESEHPFFDVETVDDSGSHLLASGEDIDPSSLALSVGASNVGERERSVTGTVVYWRKGGVPSSAELR
jgi:hypothetical protein